MKFVYQKMLLPKLTLSVLVFLLAMDALLGLVYKTNTNAEILIKYPRAGIAHRAIVVFPGYIMPGDTLLRAFAPYVQDHDALIVVNYAERGVKVQQIFDKVMVALNNVRPDELRIYGASMGGMLSSEFLDHYHSAGMPFGKVVLVLDSAPASRDNIKRPSCLFYLSCIWHGGPLSSAIWALISKFSTKPPLGNSASQNIVSSARHDAEWIGMPALTTQACFISNFASLKDGELVDVAKQVVYLVSVR